MSQRGVVERLLRERGADGVSAHELIYRYGITRSAAIVHELKKEKGWNIETIDDGKSEDGRQRLARYVLRPGRPPVATQPLLFDPQAALPEPTDNRLPCGCVRSADGRSWKARCERHAA